MAAAGKPNPLILLITGHHDSATAGPVPAKAGRRRTEAAMADGELRWSAAAEAAAEIAGAWGPGEPGGGVAVFDTREIRAEACGGVDSLAGGTAFSGDTVVRYASVTKH